MTFITGLQRFPATRFQQPDAPGSKHPPETPTHVSPSSSSSVLRDMAASLPRIAQTMLPSIKPMLLMDIKHATDVLDRSFQTFDTAKQGGGRGDGRISLDDLKTVAENKNGTFTAEQQAAARFLLNSKAGRNFLDTAGRQAMGVDGIINRKDIDAAKSAIADGSYTHRMLDTASTNGGCFTWPDGKVSQTDIDAALQDPGIPQSVKDSIQFARQGQSDVDLGFLGGLTADKAEAASKIFNSPEYRSLGGEEKTAVANLFRESKGDASVMRDAAKLMKSPDFRSANSASRIDRLHEIAILHSDAFKSMPAHEQKLVHDIFSARNPDDVRLAQSVKHLLGSGKYRSLSAEEKTAVLSQLKNYPDSQVADNFSALLKKSWFSGSWFTPSMSLEDKQRTLKAVAYLTTDQSGDATIRQNTLNRILNDDSYSLAWDNIPPHNGSITFGYRKSGSASVVLNSHIFSAGNTPVQTEFEIKIATDTLAHEVNHAVNDDHYAATHQYLNEEYRAWYVGYKAKNGYAPSRKEALQRWSYFLDPNQNAYPGSNALKNPTEASKIFQTISELTGQPVYDEKSMRTAMSSTIPNENAPATLPLDGDVDN